LIPFLGSGSLTGFASQGEAGLVRIFSAA